MSGFCDEEASSLRWDELVKIWCPVTHIGEGCAMPPVTCPYPGSTALEKLTRVKRARPPSSSTCRQFLEIEIESDHNLTAMAGDGDGGKRITRYSDFVKVHWLLLAASGLPQSLHFQLFQKLTSETFDGGAHFSIEPTSDGRQRRLLLTFSDMSKESHVGTKLSVFEAMESVIHGAKENGDGAVRWLELEELDIDDDTFLSLDLSSRFPVYLHLACVGTSLRMWK
ncbi:hypothetical protein CMV_017825 [Castanea mollissima]|uniref:Uncharacterized protein n=1 Tax=Castanea mollissima TaxID=60419 RepID=A0A8J4QSG4_9ROSI|nr:hypothetical protein CMV_017825 [Castanea mollissima]